MKNIQLLHHALEKQVIDFNDIILYDKQKSPEIIYSPLLVNMMVSVGPQIESVVRLLKNQLGLKSSGKGMIQKLIKELNQDYVLDNLKIVSTLTNQEFSPFDSKVDWWHAYNKTKHDLLTGQFEVGYVHVMNAMAALSALYYLASLSNREIEYGQYLLKKSYWIFDDTMLYNEEPVIHRGSILKSHLWKSLLFKIYSMFSF